MENSKSNILLLSEESLIQISNPDHVRYVLGIEVPLTESTTEYSETLLNEIIEKQLVLEGVLDTLKTYLKDKYNTFVDTIKSPIDVFILIKNLITNPEALKSVYNTYRVKVDNYKKTFEETLLKLSDGLESIAEKFTKIPEDIFQSIGTTMQVEIDGYKNLVSKIKKYFDGVVNYINKEVGKDWLGLIKSIVINGVLGFVIDKIKFYITKLTNIIDWAKPKESIKKLRDDKIKSQLNTGLDNNIAKVFESLKGLTSKSLDSVQGFFKDIMSGKNWLWKYIVKFLSKIAKEVKSTIKKVGNIDITHYGRMERDLKTIQDSYLRRLINNLLMEELNKDKNDNIYNKNITMSNKIKRTVKNNIRTLLETKGFEDMEVAFGVKEKSDNLSDAEKKQFGEWETVQDKESGLVNLGDPSVQPALNKVHKDEKKDAEAYYKEVGKRMKDFQKTTEAEPSQIGEAVESPKVNREDDQTEDMEVYSTEALGPGMLALKYDNEGTPVHDKFEERMEEMNGDDLTYKKLRAYSEKYLKHKYKEPNEYHYSPKVRETDKPINEGMFGDEEYVDPIKQKAEEKYSQYTHIRVDNKPLSVIPPGEYVTLETDYERVYPSGPAFKVTEPMNPRELAIQVSTKTGWFPMDMPFELQTNGAYGNNKRQVKHIFPTTQTSIFEQENTQNDLKGKTSKSSDLRETYADVIKENIFKTKGKITSKDQISKLVNKIPTRVKIDETVFAITDGENYYRLIWEGAEDGEAVITHEKNTNIVSESINKMKHLWDFNSSESLNKKPSIKENDEVFFKMMNTVRGK